MKGDLEQKAEAQSKEYEYRVKSLEDKNKSLLALKADLEQEVRHLQEAVMKTRLEAEEDLREAVVRVQEEEVRKFASQLRTVEQKLKVSEETRETMAKKNQELVRDVAERDKFINQRQLEHEQEKARLKQEISEYHNQCTQTNIVREKLRNELQGTPLIVTSSSTRRRTAAHGGRAHGRAEVAAT